MGVWVYNLNPYNNYSIFIHQIYIYVYIYIEEVVKRKEKKKKKLHGGERDNITLP